MSVTGHQWAQAAQIERGELQKALAYTDQLIAQHKARREEVVAEATRALDALTAMILPRLDAECLQYAARLTGFSRLVNQDLLSSMRAEEADLRARLARAEGNPRLAKARSRQGAETAGALAKLEEEHDKARLVIDLCGPERMDRLIASGYGTASYDVPFWRLSYYRDWRASDAILEMFPGMTFPEVCDNYKNACAAASTVAAQIVAIRSEATACDAILREHATVTEALRTVQSRHLGRARHHLGRFILDMGPSALGPRLAAFPEVEALAKQVYGLAAKVRYLDQVGKAQLLTMRAQIEQAMAKCDRDVAKYLRRKNVMATFPSDLFQKRFSFKQERYLKAWKRYQKTSDTLCSFNRYHRARLSRDFLFWDLMTHGRIDGDFIPEVAEHHRYHPHDPSADNLHEEPADNLHEEPADNLHEEPVSDDDADAAAAAEIEADNAGGGGAFEPGDVS